MNRTLLCAALLLGCDADVTTTCVGGDGTCDTHQLGGELPPDPCFDDCDVVNPSGRTGEFPCAVQPIMDNCQRCHTELATPLVEGAPFPLDTYEQTQEIYLGMAIWARLKRAIDNPDAPDFMPLLPPKLTPEQKVALLDEWVCKCAPPREEGEVCE